MPRTNVFLIINLGCEMLYVIDQRLKAQSISVEKSAQVLRDLTCVLLDPKLIEQLIHPHPYQNILTVQQCRILLTDIACCSLMRLDVMSMDKLWDLMIMLFKWQLFIIRHTPHKLLDITFRHMDGMGRLLPEMKKTILIDCTKRILIEYWDICTDTEKYQLYEKLMKWTKPFNVKISILIRLGFQRGDGSFERVTDQSNTEHFQDYIDNIGENIYAKNNVAKPKQNTSETSYGYYSQSAAHKHSSVMSNELDTLVNQLNINHEEAATRNDDAKEEKSECEVQNNVLLLDDVNCFMSAEVEQKIEENNPTETTSKPDNNSEFVHLKSAQSALQGYLEEFRMENKQNSTDEANAFDATTELLKMLDEE